MEEKIRIKGKVIQVMGKGLFLVEAENLRVQCMPSGKMRKMFIRILVEDEVDIEVSPYNLKLGRILYRYK